MPKDIKHIRNGISCQSQIKISHPIPQRKQIQVQRIPRNHIISNHNSRLCLLCSNNISAVCIRLLNVKNFLWRPQILINNRNNMIAGADVLIIDKNVGKGRIAGSYFTNNHMAMISWINQYINYFLFLILLHKLFVLIQRLRIHDS